MHHLSIQDGPTLPLADALNVYTLWRCSGWCVSDLVDWQHRVHGRGFPLPCRFPKQRHFRLQDCHKYSVILLLGGWPHRYPEGGNHLINQDVGSRVCRISTGVAPMMKALAEGEKTHTRKTISWEWETWNPISTYLQQAIHLRPPGAVSGPSSRNDPITAYKWSEQFIIISRSNLILWTTLLWSDHDPSDPACCMYLC